MEAQAATAAEPVIGVPKRDLIEAWSALDKLVVSLRKMGSYYAMPDEHTPLASDRREAMLEALDKFLSGDTWQELSRARRLLAECLPGEEIEHLSEHVIQYWQAGSTDSNE